jgi:protein-S-isoprenylcysteine O-methyltransferase Ste14
MQDSAHAILVLALYVLFLLLAFGLRSWIHYRQTGTSGYIGLTHRGSPAERLGGLLLVLALALGFAAPLLELAGWTHSAAGPLQRLLGLTLYGVGGAGTLLAQLQMGRSWRVGVDPAEHTALVERGLYRWIRNPIYTAMLTFTVGLLLLLPNQAALLAFALLLLGLELHVRFVEEPHLLRQHGDAYRSYAGRVGRFLPGLGRLAPPAP